ncbi:hypothetical protein RJ639_031010 [Escallonia herrerae]|uniref:Elongator complex protein 5 n=1 Tax=Escallonia herrerae TaxID=1293975 RepID=A0AA89BAW3_9ASTE|nr:hypothetical protein RJ639_031010 [Escallonia herrerae]
MAESVCRALRDGALDGEHAPALAIKDSGDSPFGPAVFSHVLTQLASNVLAGKSQSRGIVLVALSRSPAFYVELLKSRGIDVASLSKWFVVLDCYTDPLGWKERLMERGSIMNSSPKASVNPSLCKDISDLDKLFSLILQRGKGFLGEGKSRFSVAIDSVMLLSTVVILIESDNDDYSGHVSEMLRHTSTSSVASLISNLRSHNLVSCVFWLLHSDFHEIRVAAALEYLSSMLASIEQMTRPDDVPRNNSQNISLLEHNYRRGKFHVRFKRRNGRVRVMSEEFQVEQSRIKFMSVSSEDGMIAQSLVPKVQFSLQLSEKEKVDRAKVVLPFEHQGNGRSIDIYDGRRSLNDGKRDAMPASSEKVQTSEDSGRGEIIYFRDSDDEMPDSDEDPDDDLDI